MEGSTGTEVKRALTSKDVITSPGLNLLERICWTKYCVFLRWWGDWPTRDLMMYASSFATPFVMETLLDTMGLRGCQHCVFWGGHKIWGTALVGYSFLYFESLIPPDSFISFNVCMSLFLSLEARYLLRTL